VFAERIGKVLGRATDPSAGGVRTVRSSGDAPRLVARLPGPPAAERSASLPRQVAFWLIAFARVATVAVAECPIPNQLGKSFPRCSRNCCRQRSPDALRRKRSGSTKLTTEIYLVPTHAEPGQTATLSRCHMTFMALVEQPGIHFSAGAGLLIDIAYLERRFPAKSKNSSTPTREPAVRFWLLVSPDPPPAGGGARTVGGLRRPRWEIDGLAGRFRSADQRHQSRDGRPRLDKIGLPARLPTPEAIRYKMSAGAFVDGPGPALVNLKSSRNRDRSCRLATR